MAEPDERLAASLAALDAANALDPTVVVHEGVERPKELLHAEVAHRWLLRLDPSADALQQLAVRAHHLRRWVEPRSSHPEGRAGYLRWRAAQKRRHAEEAAAILAPLGWADDELAEVGRLVRKEGLGSDERVQHHEDALCATFVELQLDEVAGRLGEARTVEVVRKTLAKMSDEAIAAVGELALPARASRVLAAALDP